MIQETMVHLTGVHGIELNSLELFYVEKKGKHKLGMGVRWGCIMEIDVVVNYAIKH